MISWEAGKPMKFLRSVWTIGTFVALLAARSPGQVRAAEDPVDRFAQLIAVELDQCLGELKALRRDEAWADSQGRIAAKCRALQLAKDETGTIRDERRREGSQALRRRPYYLFHRLERDESAGFLRPAPVGLFRSSEKCEEARKLLERSGLSTKPCTKWLRTSP